MTHLNMDASYSYADYLTWKFDETVELIKGKIFEMSAPKTNHQRVSWRLCGVFYNHLKNKPCQAFAAPFDVRLLDKNKSVQANKDIMTVVQPDICVICEESKIDENGCLGSPDLIIEILSAGNSKKEMKTKFELYEENGVKEYWVVNVENEYVLQYVLENEKYVLAKHYVDDELLKAHIFDLEIDLQTVFH